MPPHPPLLPGAVAASLAAGPTFLFATAAAQLYLILPSPIEVDLSVILPFLLLSIPAVIVGALFAFVPILFGSLLMFGLGSVLEAGRAPAAWGIAGGAAGAGIAAVAGVYPGETAVSFGVAATGAVCALISRNFAAFSSP